VQTLADLPQIKTEGDVLTIRPYGEYAARGKAAAAHALAELREHPLYGGLFVAADGKTTAVLIEPKVTPDRPVELWRGYLDTVKTIFAAEGFARNRLHIAGGPTHLDQMIRSSRRNLVQLFPIVAIALLLVVLALYRAIWPIWPTLATALIAVLWLIAILAMASVATLQMVGMDVKVVHAQIAGFRARQLAEMGVAVAANPAVKRDDPILSQETGEGEGYKVRIASEAARFNINSLLLRGDKPVRRSIFMDWGLDMDQADSVVDALNDWVDGDDFVSLNGAEKDWYEERGRINQPFNRPFYSLDEMRLVAGMGEVEKLYPNWRDWFTVWSGGALDVNEAEPDLIAAAAEVSVDDAVAVVETVLGPDQIRDTEDDARFRNLEEVLAILGVPEMMRPIVAPRLTVNDTTTRIESIGYTPGARHKITLVLRNRTGRPAILERKEESIP
jgi:hypothetical protein